MYTKPRNELKVAQDLTKAGIENYCPTIVEVKQWSDRKKKIISPLFKSYVFVKIANAKRDLVFEVPGIVRYLFWLGKPARVKEEEIGVIRNWLESDELTDPEIDHLSPGDHITIANGNFKGQEAIISKIGKKRLRLILKTMGFVVNVKISEAVE